MANGNCHAAIRKLSESGQSGSHSEGGPILNHHQRQTRTARDQQTPIPPLHGGRSDNGPRLASPSQRSTAANTAPQHPAHRNHTDGSPTTEAETSAPPPIHPPQRWETRVAAGAKAGPASVVHVSLHPHPAGHGSCRQRTAADRQASCGVRVLTARLPDIELDSCAMHRLSLVCCHPSLFSPRPAITTQTARPPPHLPIPPSPPRPNSAPQFHPRQAVSIQRVSRLARAPLPPGLALRGSGSKGAQAGARKREECEKKKKRGFMAPPSHTILACRGRK